MENLFDITLKNRQRLHHILENTSKEDLLKIPEGFRNNIWWNIAHVVATQQILMYKLGGRPLCIPEELVEKFKKGTVPDGMATDDEIEQVKKLLFSTVEEAITDYDNGLFSSYNEYTTSANVTLKNVDDAIPFNFFHEGLHYGSILALQKAVNL